MRVLVVYEGALVSLPPLISLLKVIKALGHEISFLGEARGNNEKMLADMGIATKLVPSARSIVSLRRHPFRRIYIEVANRFNRDANRNFMRRTVEAHMISDDRAVVWTIGYSIVRTLGCQLATYGRRHINTAYELEDIQSPRFRDFDYLACLKNATLVQCELNRAEIFAAINRLDRVPFVIPNCPYDHPRSRNLPIPVQAIEKQIKAWGNRTVFLYQGAISADRNGLVQNLEELCRAFPDAVVAVMPAWTDGNYGKLPSYDNFCLIPNLPAPQHLLVTSHATIGVAYYARKLPTSVLYSPLNTIFCAPNKIYEYTGFGIPILGNDIAGLRNSIGIAGAGLCYTETSLSIVDAAKLVLSDYQTFSRGAEKFFSQVNLDESIGRILKSISA